MATEHPATTEYAGYLRLHAILNAQAARSHVHEETAFIISHQIHELLFKQLLHELRHAQRQLDRDAPDEASHALRRAAVVIGAMRAPLDVLATIAPHRFHEFREELGSASGFQSANFREIEAVLGRRGAHLLTAVKASSDDHRRIADATSRPCLYDSLLAFLSRTGYPIPDDLLDRDHRSPLPTSSKLRATLRSIYLAGGGAMVLCEQLAQLDDLLEEWRANHHTLVAEMLGTRSGTGGTSGADYLRSTVAQVFYPDLRTVRNAS